MRKILVSHAIRRKTQKRDFGQRIELDENISFQGQPEVDLIELNEALEALEKFETTQAKIVEHICALTDGDCKYTGDTMKQSHAGMNISEAEFYLMVEALRSSLDRHVGEREKNELLKILAPMKRDIVGG